METIDLVPMIQLLDDSIDDLEEALEPLLKCALSETAGKLPLLDRAQLYVLVTYAIESMLFSYLRLNGVNSKDHPVFRELARVKGYFEKVKTAESAGTTQTVRLDKAAAGRFIKHALAKSKEYDDDMAKRGGMESIATDARFEEVPRNQINNGSRAISPGNEPNSNLEHLKFRDSSKLKRKKWQGSL